GKSTTRSRPSRPGLKFGTICREPDRWRDGQTMKEIIPFAGNPLDRASNLRRDEAWLERQMFAADSRFLPFWRLNPLARSGGEPGLHWLDGSVLPHLDDEPPVLLGIKDGVAHFAVDLSSMTDPVATIGIEEAAFSD